MISEAHKAAIELALREYDLEVRERRLLVREVALASLEEERRRGERTARIARKAGCFVARVALNLALGSVAADLVGEVVSAVVEEAV